jgi:RND superfamily putative drug exporter
MALSTETIVRRSAKRPWFVLAIWFLVLLAGFVLNARYLSSALTTDVRYTNNPESKRAAELLEQRLLGPHHASEVIIVQSGRFTVHDAQFQSFLKTLSERIIRLGPGVVIPPSPSPASGPPMASKDGHTTLIPVTMAGTVDEASKHIASLHRVTLEGPTPAGFRVMQFGDATVSEDFTKIAEKDMKKGEVIGIAIALVILLIVFGSAVAAAIPILLGVVDIAIGLGLVGLFGRLYHFTFTVTNMITMIGLAVGIDYSLFILSRYREERAQGLNKEDAIAVAGGTASRAVLFSGTTVVLALCGMLLLPLSIFKSMAAGAIFVVAVAILASLTLLPAVLSIMGDRVNAGRIPFLGRRAANNHDGGFWDWATRTVTARPLTSLIIATGVVLAAGSSLYGMRTGFSGISSLPPSVQSRQAFAELARDFSGGLTSPAQVVIAGPVRDLSVQAATSKLYGLTASDGAFGPGTLTANEAGNLALFSLPFRGDPNSSASYDAIRRLRSTLVPKAFEGSGAHVLVGGSTASAVDFFALTHTYTPLVFAFVLALSFLLLTVVFRSIVVPVTSIILNLLSVGAAYGLVVLVNQRGVGARLFGFQKADLVEAWFPLFLFCILFGLSMDYHVFLLSRIRERYDKTRDNREAVAVGLRSTGRIITGAAVIMVAVFAGFAAGDLVMMQEMGFGLAIAVLLDATIVRSVLVPSVMELLGDRNWYLPSWLRWLPEVRFESPRRTAMPPPVIVQRAPRPGRLERDPVGAGSRGR